MKSKLIKTALVLGLASGNAFSQTNVPQEFRGALSPGDLVRQLLEKGY